MKHPLQEFRDTKANILALATAHEGAVAWATDTDELGAYDGAAWQWLGGGAGGPHNLLSATHPDTAVQTVSRGSLVYGNATPAWDELAHPGGAGYALITNATDVLWSQTPTWTGKHTFNVGIGFGGGAGANILQVPDNIVDALSIEDAGGIPIEYLRVVSTDANPYLLLDPTNQGVWIGIGTNTPAARLDILLDGAPQLRLTYTKPPFGVVHTDIETDSEGRLVITPTGGLLGIVGNLVVGGTSVGANATKTLVLLNGTIPSTSPVDAVQLYAKDVDDSSELFARNEAGGIFQVTQAGGDGDSTHTATYAARPAPSNDGDLFLPSDGFVVERDTGAAWVPWGPIFPFTAPVNDDFSWVNQNDASVVTTFGGIVLSDPAEANTNPNYALRVKSAPSAPYTIDAAFLLPPYPDDNYICPLVFGWRESSSGKLSMFRLIRHTASWRWSHLKASSPTVDVANYVEEANIDDCQGLLWLRIEDDNTNRKIFIGSNGQTWYQFHSIGRTDYLTPDQVCFGICSRQTTYAAHLTLLHWKEA